MLSIKQWFDIPPPLTNVSTLYLGKHEPQKLSFSYAVYILCLENYGASAYYLPRLSTNFDNFFVNYKVLL